MHTRRKKELSIRFRFRISTHTQGRRQLQIRLLIRGERVSDYGTGVYIEADKWDQYTQQVKGRNQLAAQANERLAEIIAQHHEMLRELKRRHEKGEGPRPTAKMVRAEFVHPGSTSPRLLGWLMTYLNYLDSLHGTPDGRAEKTIARAYKAHFYAAQFDTSSPYLTDITTGWGKRFHIWLQTHPETGKRRMQKDSANKYLSHVRDALNHAVDEGALATNPLDKFRPKRGKGKDVYFLEPEHIERLLGLALPDQQAGYVVWWAKLMCFTGLDYVDAIRYAKDRNRFQRRNAAGVKIVIERAKPPCNTCEIPLIGQIGEQVEALFAEYPAGPPAPVLADLNRHLKLLQVAIGFDKTLTKDSAQVGGGSVSAGRLPD